MESTANGAGALSATARLDRLASRCYRMADCWARKGREDRDLYWSAPRMADYWDARGHAFIAAADRMLGF